MTGERRTARVEFPTDLEVRVTREFEAPRPTVWDAFMDPALVRRAIVPLGAELAAFEMDVREGGDYRYAFSFDGFVVAFQGSYLEVAAPDRAVLTFTCDLWPDVEAVETLELGEDGAVTTVALSLVFADLAARATMTSYDGILANLDAIDDLLHELTAGAS